MIKQVAALIVATMFDFYRLKTAGFHVHVPTRSGVMCANGGDCPAGRLAVVA